MIHISVKERKSTAVIGIGTILFGLLVGAALVFFRKADRSPGQMLPDYFVVFCMILSGVFLCMSYRRELLVEDMQLCYRNWLGRKKSFSLDDIGYCRQRASLILYDLNGDKLCKLEFGMTQIPDFLQYLMDNRVEVESNKRDKKMLDVLYDMQTIDSSRIAGELEQFAETVRGHKQEWEIKVDRLDASFQIGFACYLESEIKEDRQLPEQSSSVDGWLADEVSSLFSNRLPDELPEGFVIVMEGYLLKDGEYVVNRKEQAVCLVVPVIHVVKSYQIGQKTKTILYRESFDEWKNQIADLMENLPKHRYHTAEITLRHKLKAL